MNSSEKHPIFRPNRSSLPDQIADNMIQQIESGNWAVGEKIPSEPELMEMFDVSRNTIREATKSLVFAGMLDSRPGIGTRVISRSQLDASLNKCWNMAQIHELYDVRLLFESELAALAARNHTQEELEELERLQSVRDHELVTDTDMYYKNDADYHLHIARMSHNQLMYDIYESMLYTSIKRYVSLIYNLGYTTDTHEHREIFEAIRDRDENRARETVKAYLGRTAKLVFDATNVDK